MQKPNHWRFDDLEGMTFDRLKVVEYAGKIGARTAWRCVCECGSEHFVRGTSLRTGNVRSCGCLYRDAITAHGWCRTPTWRCWAAMKSRCYTTSNREFARYGGHGITVCDRWRADFLHFLEDMGERPSLQHTVDRIDGTGGYEPGNCRWATRREQGNNRRTNRLYEHEGRVLSATQWAREAGISPETMRSRLRAGRSLAEALMRPVTGAR